MKTIQVVLDLPTLRAADREAKRGRVNRSAFIRAAIKHYVRAARLRELEERDRRGYERVPVEAGEFDVWEKASVWPED